MLVYVSVKQAGKRKEFITKKELELAKNPASLRELITEVVQITVQEYLEKAVEPALVHYLTLDNIEAQAAIGKVGFGERKNANDPDLTEATNTAILAFEDGLYRIFNGEKELTVLDEPLNLSEGDVLTFLRFTMLAGRMW